MPKKKTQYSEPEQQSYACSAEGCAAPATYKAPKAKNALHEYTWFCLDHIREYNQRWDFFDGMERDEIEAFISDAVTGHRPTWQRETHVGQRLDQLQHALYEFMHGRAAKQAEIRHPHLNARLRAALAALDIDYPYTPEKLKSQYRTLVKKHHPDVNKGSAEAEERFKQITAAYLILIEHHKTQE